MDSSNNSPGIMDFIVSIADSIYIYDRVTGKSDADCNILSTREMRAFLLLIILPQILNMIFSFKKFKKQIYIKIFSFTEFYSISIDCNIINSSTVCTVQYNILIHKKYTL